ncbi:hypothetical protein [Mesorhizobium xinjiangense]|nr:hypothetical protein [Mesorhizobium xinjiangense]
MIVSGFEAEEGVVRAEVAVTQGMTLELTADPENLRSSARMEHAYAD